MSGRNPQPDNEKMNEFLRSSRTIEEMTLNEEIREDPVTTKINEFIRRGARRGWVEVSSDDE